MIPIIGLDPGHGVGERYRNTGAVGPTWVYERHKALELALMVRDRLSLSHTVVMTRVEDQFVPNRQRAVIANRVSADLFLSFHFNGFHLPRATGTETLCFPNSRLGSRLAESVQSEMVSFLGLPDRGVKHRGDLVVLSATSMPAILIEPLFITNPHEEKLLLDKEVMQGLAEAIATGVRNYLATVL